MTIVYVLVGAPGSGKSTWAKEAYQSSDSPFHVFESDEYRMRMFGTLSEGIQKREYNKLVFSKMREDLLNRVVEYKDEVHGAELIYDATNISRRRRVALYNDIKKYDKDCTVIVVVFQRAYHTLKKINAVRDKDKRVPEDALHRMYVDMQPPRVGVDCDWFWFVGESFFSTDKIGNVLPSESFKKEIKGFYDNEPHDNPHHKESIREHIDMCVEATNGNWELQEVAKFHDLGKFVAKAWDDRGFYTYRGHANLSAMYHFNYIISETNVYRNYARINEAILRHMDAHQGIGHKSIRRNKLDDATLDLIERFRVIDSDSKIA